MENLAKSSISKNNPKNHTLTHTGQLQIHTLPFPDPLRVYAGSTTVSNPPLGYSQRTAHRSYRELGEPGSSAMQWIGESVGPTTNRPDSEE